MVFRKITISADIAKRTFSGVPTATQNDDIELTVDVTVDGAPMPLDDVKTATLVSTRLDQKTIVDKGEIVGPSQILFKINRRATSVYGSITVVIQLYDDALNRVSTIRGIIELQKDATGETFVPLDEEKTLIVQVLEDGPTVIESAQKATIGALEATEVVKEIVTTGTGFIDELETLKDQTEVVKTETESVMSSTEQVKVETLAVKESTELVKIATQDVLDATELVRVNTESERINTESVRINTEEERLATELVRQQTLAVKEANLTNWLNPVATVALRNSTYPNPKHGDTVRVTADTPNPSVYRFQEGNGWVKTDEYNPTAIDNVAAQLADTSRQTSVLSQDVSVVSASNNALASVEFEGRTLTSLGNTPLEPGKKYVLADKKTKVIVDGATVNGVGKFTKTGVSERPKIIRVENFEGKQSGSVVGNPHNAKAHGDANILKIPSTFTAGFSATSSFDLINSLNGLVASMFTSTNGALSQQLFSFNLIEAVERNIGRIPRTTVADKVAWLKANVGSFAVNWYGFGSSVGGIKATLSRWNATTNDWTSLSNLTHTSGSVSKLTQITTLSAHLLVDANGFIHTLAYAEPSDGTTPSVINTDYIDLEIELKADAGFTNPKVALYEVDDALYNKILVDWNADDVVNRYPVVEGTQHLQGVGVVAEGENLLPQNDDILFNSFGTGTNDNKWIDGKLEIYNGSSSVIGKGFSLSSVAGQSFNLSFEVENSSDGRPLWLNVNGKDTRSITGKFNTMGIVLPSGKIEVRFIRDGSATSTTAPVKVKDIMLTLGSTSKPFVPRNPSYLFADVKLGVMGDKKDILYPGDNNTWLLRKSVEKDVFLGGDFGWVFKDDRTGLKRFEIPNATLSGYTVSSVISLIKYNGRALLLGDTVTIEDKVLQSSGALIVSISDVETGFGETYAPLVSEVKSFFYGYQMNNGTYGTPYNGTGTKTWIPIGDATNARAVTTVPTSASPTQLSGTIQPYKLNYVLASPQTIVVTDKVEGTLKVNGLTQISVDSGYRRTIVDGKSTWAKGSKFDYTANPVAIKLTYANSIRNAVDDAVTKVQDNSTMLSVHEKAIVDLYVRVKALEVK